MKYRINRLDEKEFDIITEDGGIACVHQNEEGISTMYYQSRISECKTMDEMDEVLWDSKAYLKDWGLDASDDEIIKDALGWLVMGNTEWERDDTILPIYQTKSKI
jgi:hypothetical protein